MALDLIGGMVPVIDCSLARRAAGLRQPGVGCHWIAEDALRPAERFISVEKFEA